MDRLIATNSVPFADRDVAPGSGTPQYATDGNPGVTSATVWPAYAFNMIQDEIMAVIVAAGITPDDTNWTQLLQALLSLPGKNYQVFLSSGTFTVPAGVTKLGGKVWGGGACGNGSTSFNFSGGGGGGGGYEEGTFSSTPGTNIAITVGVGDIPTAQAGGASSIGSFISATGGGQAGAGSSGGPGSPGAGGSGSGGAVNIPGGFGGQGSGNGSAVFLGQGGYSFMGSNSFQAVASAAAQGAGPSAPFPGGGGSGSNGAVTSFYGLGQPGLVVIWW